MQPPYELAPGGAVVDAQEQVSADVRGWAFVQRSGLDVVELQGCARGGVRRLIFHGQWCSGGSGGFGLGDARYGKLAVPGRVAASTPSRMVGPWPALTSWVKTVSMTSSFNVRPPQVPCC